MSEKYQRIAKYKDLRLTVEWRCHFQPLKRRYSKRNRVVNNNLWITVSAQELSLKQSCEN
jgi:hypothetical protein